MSKNCVTHENKSLKLYFNTKSSAKIRKLHTKPRGWRTLFQLKDLIGHHTEFGTINWLNPFYLFRIRLISSSHSYTISIQAPTASTANSLATARANDKQTSDGMAGKDEPNIQRDKFQHFQWEGQLNGRMTRKWKARENYFQGMYLYIKVHVLKAGFVYHRKFNKARKK